MPIFRKKVKESAAAIFAIDAETQEEADKVFEDFFDSDLRTDERQYEEYREVMNSVSEEVENLSSFSNEDAYSRSGCVHDFFLKAPKKKPEPMYDLIFTFEDGNRQMWRDITMEQALSTLSLLNEQYILIPVSGFSSYKEGCTYKEMKDQYKRGVTGLYYKAIDRKEKTNG